MMLMVELCLGLTLFNLLKPHSMTPVRHFRFNPRIAKRVSEGQNPWELSGHYQGDIILEKTRNVVTNSKYRWPQGEVPYTISPKFSREHQYVIRRSLNHLSSISCIKPRPRTAKDAYGIFVSNEGGHGCSTRIGFLNRTHLLYLDPRLMCVRFGVVLHELLHVLGFWHQQSSIERDDYIDIQWKNIAPGHEYNFGKANEPTTSFGLTYDYHSIMHYSKKAFSRNGQDTIIPKAKNVVIGQRHKLSDFDILKLNKLYNCTHKFPYG